MSYAQHGDIRHAPRFHVEEGDRDHDVVSVGGSTPARGRDLLASARGWHGWMVTVCVSVGMRCVPADYFT